MNPKVGVPQHLFKDIALPKKGLPDASKMRYRVYKDEKEFVTVEAENAKAALQASGFGKALRIERENILRVNILPFALADKEEKGAPKDAPATQEAAASQKPVEQQATAQPTEQPAAEPPKAETGAPLSSDDVNNLLKS